MKFWNAIIISIKPIRKQPPMIFQNFSWDSSILASDDLKDDNAIYKIRPFGHFEEESSQDLIEALDQDNPFCESTENKEISLSNINKRCLQDKNQKIIFKSQPVSSTKMENMKEIINCTEKTLNYDIYIKKCDKSHASASDKFKIDLNDESIIKNKVKCHTKPNDHVLSDMCNTGTKSWAGDIYSRKIQSTLVRSAPTVSSYWDSVDNGEIHTLPSIGCGRSDSLKRISKDTLAALINGTIEREYVVVDARFRYEYNGGHIANAVNISSDLELLELLNHRRIVIFHCEFSSVRGPNMAKKLRNADRSINVYPKLNIPEIYILEGGYKEFYTHFPQYCIPNSYVTMFDSRFKEECAEMHKRNKIKRK
jgi:rhodanese-related sulfurtransferase